MLDIKDFSFFENQNSFDFKGLLIKISSYWKWFILSLIVSFAIAYQVNIRKQKIYSVSSVLSLKEENNPFFTANTSLVFNWGGTSDQVQYMIVLLKSRTHNEVVVDKMQYYIDYTKEGKYYDEDVYGAIPFNLNIDKTKNQLLGQKIKIKFLNANEYSITINFENNITSTFNYSNYKIAQTNVGIGIFEKRFKVGQKVNLPFLNWKLDLQKLPENYIGQEYNITFNDFNGTVNRYQGIQIINDEKSGSILNLVLEGTNKNRMVDYLNTTIEVLIKNQLNKKNLFATNTIKFIDSTLSVTEQELKNTNIELRNFQKGKNLSDLSEGGIGFSKEIKQFDVAKDEINRKIVYLNSLKSYLNNNYDFSRLSAPSVVGINEPNIVVNVSKLISLSIARSQMAYTVKNEKLFNDFDTEMDAIKGILLENINSYRSSLNYDMALIIAKINEAESLLTQLPEQKQELTKIERKFNLNDNIYQNFLAKKSEAEVVKAANISDIHFIDSAKDVGGGLIGPKTNINYIIAFFAGLLLPLIIILILFFVNNSIQTVDDLSRLTKIPLIGIIGKKTQLSNLAVFEKPKSSLSESFRAIRSSLQFIYKKNHVEGTKTLMITSTIGGEGKTFCAVNIATVFALSEKKTVIVGLDLRKPKLFDDFQIKNNFGVVNYLINQKKLDELIQNTHIPFLDVITSGPIPPNPSELIMSEAMAEMFKELKQKYDYIILDTPPIGLVTDAVELAQFCDVTLYIIRQNYTKKDMVTLLNNLEKRGELNNISLIFNGFESKAKYGYGSGYDYGYGNYANSYHENDKTKNIFTKYYQKIFKK